jgi:N-acetylmuramoyl-L-alanine amidase
VRFVSEALDFFVHWDPAEYVVTILTPDPPAHIPAPTPIPAATPPAPPPIGPGFPAGQQGGEEAPEPLPPSQVYVPDDPGVETAVAIANFARDVSTRAMTAADFPLAAITGFSQPSAGEFAVTADSPLSRVDKTLLKDNRLILDFYNAEDKAPQPAYNFGYTYLKSVRNAQNMTAPQMVTRFVFDITGAVSFSVRMADDRKSVIVKFEQNYITDVSFYREGSSDKITISGVTAPNVSLSALDDPPRLIIDLPLSNMLTAVSLPVSGTSVSRITAAQHDPSTGRVTAELKRGGQYSVSKIGGDTIITISEQTLKDFSYNPHTRSFILPKPKLKSIAVSEMIEEDNYLGLTYTFTLPGDYQAEFGSGVTVINGGGISTAELVTAGGRTRLIINETEILAYSVTEDAAAVYIKAVSPKERYSRIVVIDPGHGGSDPGGVNGAVQEKDFTLDISLRLARMFDGGVKAYFTRLDDSYPTRSERAIFGNQLADIFVSVHCNKFNGIASGTETLFMPHANDAETGFASERLAEIIQKNVVSALGTKDRGAKYQDVQVLRESVIPACLAEISFIDSQPDLSNLQTENYRQRAAEAIRDGIYEAFDTYKPRR